MEKKLSTLDVLLRSDLPDMRKDLPEKKVEITRLSLLAGEPVEFTVRALTYKQVRELQDRSEDRSAYGVLYGWSIPTGRTPSCWTRKRAS